MLPIDWLLLVLLFGLLLRLLLEIVGRAAVGSKAEFSLNGIGFFNGSDAINACRASPLALNNPPESVHFVSRSPTELLTLLFI